MTGTPSGMTATPVFSPNATTADTFTLVRGVLDLVRLSGAIFFRADFTSPWAYTSPPGEQLSRALPGFPGSLVMFHIVASGSFWVEMADGSREQVTRGDVVVMPYADEHSMHSHEPAAPVSIMALLPPVPWTQFPHLVHGGEGDASMLVCGYLRGDAVLFDPVLRALPSLFVVRPPDGPAAAWVEASIQYALQSPWPPGSGTGADRRLPELLFTEVLRIYLEQAGQDRLTGWLAALRDPVVGQALSLLHAEPARAWTVDTLARSVAVSRTVLVERFHRMLGRPPIRYLTEWRIGLASGLLRTSDLGVAEIATRVGYTSEEAFSRAFKRALGQSPAHWRAERDGAAP